jgi:tetratricopeptide (TPR) repeat protein
MNLKAGALAFALAGAMATAQTQPVEALMEAGHWKRARALVESRLASNPNDPAALLWMARVKLEYGDLDGALPLAERAVALEGRNATYHAVLAQVYGRMAQRASVLRRIGLARRCKKELDIALQLDPNHVRLLAGYMEFLWEAPGVIGGDKRMAREIPERVGRINAARGYLAAAQLAELERDRSKLEELYRKAVEADARCYEAHTLLGGLYLERNPVRFDLVENHARAALAIDSGRVGGYTLLAAGYALQERWSDLEMILAQAEKNLPDDLAPNYAAGNILLRSGKGLPRAEAALRKYLTQEPEPNSPPIWAGRWRLGLVLEKMSRGPEAIAELEAALKMKPDSEEIKNDLKRLQRQP